MTTCNGCSDSYTAGVIVTEAGPVPCPECNAEQLQITVEQGNCGVLRVSIRAAGRVVAEARLLGSTIDVPEDLRRRGYGLSLLNRLVEMGGRSALCVTSASRGLFEKAGFTAVAAESFEYQLKARQEG